MRRETARFSSNSGMAGGLPTPSENRGYFDEPPAEERMGRGERSKKKRRFRSLSPLGRSGTPGGRGTPDTGGITGYGGGGSLTEFERNTWRCSHCKVHGTSVWCVRDGPSGPRVRLSAIIVGSSLSEIESYLDGLRIFTAKTCCTNEGISRMLMHRRAWDISALNFMDLGEAVFARSLEMGWIYIT
ncbi:hypothetical protein EYC84_010430 [Monilinia fructicola]|uniref:Uncharacterized protein n=1 Tax=Monilinia fructicola TaxID=38448 RepID=A0A5M9JDR3_MONFR|nr:hypothetical protein EYC84_010430 [Monilinia fructicola]